MTTSGLRLSRLYEKAPHPIEQLETFWPCMIGLVFKQSSQISLTPPVAVSSPSHPCTIWIQGQFGGTSKVEHRPHTTLARASPVLSRCKLIGQHGLTDSRPLLLQNKDNLSPEKHSSKSESKNVHSPLSDSTSRNHQALRSWEFE